MGVWTDDYIWELRGFRLMIMWELRGFGLMIMWELRGFGLMIIYMGIKKV